MATAMLPDDEFDRRGRLANNGMKVKALQTALSRAETNINTIPKLIRNIARQDAWREFLFPEAPDSEYGWNAADFRAFIESPRPSGCETPVHVLEKMLRGTDAWETYLELTRGERGGLQHDNREESGRFSAPPAKPEITHNRDEMTDVDVPPTIPLSSAPKPRRKRDYSREAPTGTSTSYNLRRLKARPDLYDKVKAGEMSAHKAVIEAGLVVRRFSVPDDPEAAARVILKHFRGEALQALIAALQAGPDSPPPEAPPPHP